MKKENSKGKSQNILSYPGNKSFSRNKQNSEAIKRLSKYKKSIEPDEYDEYYRYRN